MQRPCRRCHALRTLTALLSAHACSAKGKVAKAYEMLQRMQQQVSNLFEHC